MKRQTLEAIYRCLLLMLIALYVISCEKKSEEQDLDKNPPEQTIKLNRNDEVLYVGDYLVLNPIFIPAVSKPQDHYRWEITDKEVAEINVYNNFSARITAKSVGQATAFISTQSGESVAECVINVTDQGGDDVIKILAIGNSFSDDAIEHYLYGLVEAAGHSVVIGNLFSSGATLSLHWQNASTDAATYSYRKINQDGVKEKRANTSISMALVEEDWDYISFQQASSYSGQYQTFVEPLSALYDYVKGRATNPQVKYILHQTWAYPQNTTASAFARYGNDQETMYAAIVDAYIQAKGLINADLIVPAGTAIQNGRTSVVGDNFHRDASHLDLHIGRYTASAAWFEAIFGESVIGNTYKPAALSDDETKIAQHAAHYAVSKPHEVTSMADF